MTVIGEPQGSVPAEGEPAARPSRRRDGLAVREVCPFLIADEGTWRSAYAAREHRCGAVEPPAQLADSIWPLLLPLPGWLLLTHS